MLDVLIPTQLQLLTWLAVFGQTVVFYLLGRCVWHQAPAVVNVVAGWGLVGMGLLLWGSLTPWPLWGGWCVLLIGLVAGLVWQRPQLLPSKSERLAWLLMLPVLVLTLSSQPAQWDEFSHWLWAGQYLTEFHHFQSWGLPPSWAGFPAYPQFLPIIFYAPSLLVGHFAETAVAVFNTLLFLGVAGMAAWIIRHKATAIAPWRAAVLGVLLASLLNPVFVPKLIFVAYADMPLGVALMVAVWAVMMGLNSHGWRPFITAGLALAVVVGLKQIGLVLAAIVIILTGILWLLVRPRAAWQRLLVSILPALFTYAVWRWYVTQHMPIDEFSFRAWEDWHFAHYQTIFGAMWHVMTNKGHYFIPMLAIAIAGLTALLRPTMNRQLCWLAGGVCVGYNLFLGITYFGAFTLNEASHAASFWRYNTTFGWLIPIVLASTVAPWLVRRCTLPRYAATTLTVVIGIGLAVLPLLVVGHLRFDNKQGKAALREFADKIIALEQPACILPYVPDGGIQYAYLFLRYHLYPHTDLIQKGAAACKIELNYPMQALKKQPELPIVMRVTLADGTQQQWTAAGNDWLQTCDGPKPESATE